MRPRAPLLPACTALVLAAGLLAGCGGDGDGRTLHVYAAASVSMTFEQIADRFEEEHPGVAVEITSGGSSDLAAQIDQGAPADVFASADEATMSELVEAGLADGDPRPFATNTLQIAVPPDNPADVRSMADLTRSDVRLVTCAPEVPCGAASQELARRSGVTLRPVSEEQSVTDVLNKVTTGEADAGLVYVTDLRAAGGDALGIDVAQARSVVNVYPAVAVRGAEEPELAGDFIALLLSDVGQSALADAGFGEG